MAEFGVIVPLNGLIFQKGSFARKTMLVSLCKHWDTLHVTGMMSMCNKIIFHTTHHINILLPSKLIGLSFPAAHVN